MLKEALEAERIKLDQSVKRREEEKHEMAEEITEVSKEALEVERTKLDQEAKKWEEEKKQLPGDSVSIRQNTVTQKDQEFLGDLQYAWPIFLAV